MNASSARDGRAGQDAGRRLIEELRPLLDAATERAQPWLQRLIVASEAEQSSPGCDWCPLCAVVALIRGEHSELALRAAEHLVGLLALLRAAFADADHPAGCPHAGPGPGHPGERGSGQDGGVPPGWTGADEYDQDESEWAERSRCREQPARVQRITVRRRSAADWPEEARANEEAEC